MIISGDAQAGGPMKRALFVIAVTLFGVVMSGQSLCPCVPIAHEWVVESCDSWNCAASALVLANGDPHVMAVPAATGDGRWLVVKQVATGSYVPPADAPFVSEAFDGVDGASARFVSVAGDHAPVLLSVPDGKFLVIMLKSPAQKRKAARP
jgi:hypothetical protein